MNREYSCILSGTMYPYRTGTIAASSLRRVMSNLVLGSELAQVRVYVCRMSFIDICIKNGKQSFVIEFMSIL